MHECMLECFDIPPRPFLAKTLSINQKLVDARNATSVEGPLTINYGNK